MAAAVILLMVFVFVFALVLLPLAVHIWALVDLSQTRDEVFGPPWDNTKQDWITGLAIAFMIPMGHIVAPILWWTQVRGPKQRGERPGRPFWSSAPRPPPYAMGQGPMVNPYPPPYAQPPYAQPPYAQPPAPAQPPPPNRSGQS